MAAAPVQAATTPTTDHPTLVAPSRPYASSLPHQWQVVNDQAEGGLFSIKKTYTTLEKVAGAQLSASDPSKAVKELKAKNATNKSRDEMSAYARSAALAENVVLDTFVAHHTFQNQVNTQIVVPLGKWYKIAQKKRRDMEAKHVKETKELAGQKADLEKERVSCNKLLEELKAATKAMEAEETSDSVDKKKLPKLQSNRKSVKEKAVKAFKKYNQNLQAGRKFQTQYHSVDVPARLSDLQQIEVERLNTLGNMLHQFQSMMITLQTEIQKSTEMLQKVIPSLDPQAEINGCLDKWVKFLGPPPEIVPIPYGLPCSPEELERDVFAGPGGDSAPSGGFGGAAAAPPPPPPSSSGRVPPPETKSSIPDPPHHSNIPPPPGPPSGGSSFTPPPPPSAGRGGPPAKVGRGAPPPAAPAAGGDDTPAADEPATESVWAQALFDFEDPGAEGEVNYISFKENEYLKVHQQEDEWWFGEKTDGVTGFFPKAYVQICAGPPPS